jgi:glycosyltransferase involved in cell wall biosynthesis
MILYIYPKVTKRYAGGIMQIGEKLSNYCYKKKIDNIIFFNSITIQRGNKSAGKFNFLNLLDSVLFLLRVSFFLIKNKKTEIVHINSSSSLPLLRDTLVAFLIAKIFKKKVFLQIHMVGVKNIITSSNYLNSLMFYFLKRTDLIVLSNSFKRELLEKRFEKNSVHVCYNFYDGNNRMPFVEIKRSDTNLNLLFLGSIDKRKNINELILFLKESRLNFTLNICGSNTDLKYFECFKDLIENDNRFIFHGYISGFKLFEIFKNSDILILNSKSEGFPMVIPESFFFGCPVVTTNVGSASEIIINNYNGFIFEIGDYFNLNLFLTNLSINSNSLNQLKKGAFESYDNFSILNYFTNLMNIYEQ